jgi:uncharacterized oxidoreductase
MNMTGNTILITGGNSGIGRKLAEAFHTRGNQVIIAGRNRATLNETTSANPGMASVVVDMQDAEGIRSFAAKLTADFPALNVVIANAGIMHSEDLLTSPVDLIAMEATIATNLLGPIRLIASLLPHLQKQPQAAVLTVSSGLAFAPLVHTPTYSATKAAIHSYTQALRRQLQGTTVQVIELIPPMVATELQPGQSQHPRAMPLNEYITETIHLLETQPDADEILVERVKFQRFGAERGEYDLVFNTINPPARA